MHRQTAVNMYFQLAMGMGDAAILAFKTTTIKG